MIETPTTVVYHILYCIACSDDSAGNRISSNSATTTTTRCFCYIRLSTVMGDMFPNNFQPRGIISAEEVTHHQFQDFHGFRIPELVCIYRPCHSTHFHIDKIRTVQENMDSNCTPDSARDAVTVKSESLPAETPQVRG